MIYRLLICCDLLEGSHIINELQISEEFCMMAAQINFSLFALNMLPIPPLDGFHVYSELFPKLKALATPEISMFLMFAIFSIPAVGVGIGLVSSTLIETIVSFLS